MAEWRLARGWSNPGLRERLDALSGVGLNFTPPAVSSGGGHPWRQHGSRARIASARPGVPTDPGPFHRARRALERYAFSDPGIVEAHFDPRTPLQGRRLLLELKVPLLRYLSGVLVTEVRDETSQDTSTYGFRYDTLEGHIERGWEWFLIRKDHASGAITFHIAASWLPGDFPNWWSRVGFALVGSRYQRRWHRLAHERMMAFAQEATVGDGSTREEGVEQRPIVVFSDGETVEDSLQAFHPTPP